MSLLTDRLRPLRSWLALPILALALAPVFLSSRGPAATDSELAPTREHAAITRDVAERLRLAHLVKVKLDDALSAEVLDRYLQFLDPTRSHFTAGDVAEFDALAAGNLKPAFAIFERFHSRRLVRLQATVQMLADGSELPRFGPGAALSLKRDEEPWPEGEEALAQLWDKLLANEVLELELAGREGDAARQVLLKRYENRVLRARQAKSGDVVRVFLNAFAQSFDPHTEYFPPKEAEDFEIQMSLSVEGIGAMLGSDGVHTRIERLIPGGPAEKSGRLAATDRILAVAQGEEGEWVDVVGWRVDEVAELVRGQRGTLVRLQVLSAEQPEGSPPREIHIVREKVKLEERAATARMAEIGAEEGRLRIGVIQLPAFYLDFEARAAKDEDFRSTTRDVEKLVRELMAQEVDGIVLDLRANGGGSLDEAIGVAELFLGPVPVVQISGRDGVQTLSGQRAALYQGPLAVLVDRLSASASEILAGAVQDHGRGPVVGARTFGKGTVQVLMPARSGELKITRAMFYRASGSSTQHQGIEPDILFPSQYDEALVGESSLPHALPWKEIPPVPDLAKSPLLPLLAELRATHEARTDGDPEFAHLKARLALIEELRARRAVSLDPDERREENRALEARWLAIENDFRRARGLEPVDSLAGGGGEAEDGSTDAEEPEEEAPPAEELDALAREAAAVLADLIGLLVR
jgi:carboxyl-terminal processing protease